MSPRQFMWLNLIAAVVAILTLVFTLAYCPLNGRCPATSTSLDPVPPPHTSTTAANYPSCIRNNCKLQMTALDYLDIELNQTAKVAITPLNSSGYTLTPENFANNYTGYQFVPSNGTLYYIAVGMPANTTLLMYLNTNLVANYTESAPLNVTLIVTSTRPTATSSWNPLFGVLKIPYVMLPPYVVELVVVALSGVAIYLGYRIHPALIYFGIMLDMIIGMILVGLVIPLLVFGAYIVSYYLMDKLDREHK